MRACVCVCIAVRPGKVVLVHTPTAAAAEAEATVCAIINPLLSCPTSSPASLIHCGGEKDREGGVRGGQRAMTTEGIEAASYKAAFDI